MRTSPLFSGVNIVPLLAGNQSSIALHILPDGPPGVAVGASDPNDADCYIPSQAADELCGRFGELGPEGVDNAELFAFLNAEPPKAKRKLAELLVQVIQDAPLPEELKTSMIGALKTHKAHMGPAGILGPTD